ncbi:helix-turn-helix domain-containing protein [Streptomyces sp. NPDC020883]|uniref:helix-turn-helix domain-containing protein n=1 Tax=Streptomyces sp. NPDC020883 TaxID=3365099 RepID=UPI0037BA8C99
MGTTVAGPAARLQIAQYLMALQQRAGLRQTEVARRAGCGTTTVARYMDWRSPARLTVHMVRSIADACGANAVERDRLAELVAVQNDGWQLDDPSVPEWMDPLVSFESVAEHIDAYACTLVPGLLQTPEYALAMHQASGVDQNEAERRTAARIRRQEVLQRDDLHLSVVLAEGALRWVVGGPDVMRAQIDHLMEVRSLPNIDIRVLPFTAGVPAAGSGGNFVVLRRGGRSDNGPEPFALTVVYLELHARGLYLDAPPDTDAYRVAFSSLQDQAAGDPASALDAARKEFQ